VTLPFLTTLSFLLGAFLCWLYFQFKKGGLRALADEIVHRAEIESEEKLAKQELKLKERAFAFDQNLKKLETESLEKSEKLRASLDKREERIEQQERILDQKRRQLEHAKQETQTLKLSLEERQAALKKSQENFLGLPLDQAREHIRQELLEKVQQTYAEELNEKALRYKKEEIEPLKKMMIESLGRLDLPSCLDLFTSSIPLPNEEMKRRLIGREGKNIRHLERLTGVNFLLDETPGAVVLSTFDPMRREIAKMSIETLMRDGRIHPSRIEEVVEKTKAKWENSLFVKGREAAQKAGVEGLSEELITLLGRLYFLTTSGQNVWAHSIEVSHIMGSLAAELNFNVALCRRIGLLHDIGKAVIQSSEEPHALVGKQTALKHGESEIVANGVGAHHDDIPPESFEAALCPLANALSSMRLGARSSSVDPFLQRLQKFESFAKKLPGVEQTYVLQAGREIRVFVSPGEVNEWQAQKIAKQIAQRIEEETSYRGKVKVCVVRETKAVEYAL
jgi:ribonucrease Y